MYVERMSPGWGDWPEFEVMYMVGLTAAEATELFGAFAGQCAAASAAAAAVGKKFELVVQAVSEAEVDAAIAKEAAAETAASLLDAFADQCAKGLAQAARAESDLAGDIVASLLRRVLEDMARLGVGKVLPSCNQAPVVGDVPDGKACPR